MNTATINALIENPSGFLAVFIFEPLPSAMLAYYLVWLTMRPNDGSKIRNSFFWHSCGVATTVIFSSIFRIIAIATFAGHSAYDPPAEDGVLAFYIFIVPALVATGYVALLKPFRIPVNTTESGKHSRQESLLSEFNPFRCTTEITRRLSIALLSASLLAWFTWIGVASDGFSGVKPVGWLLIFGAPLGTFIALRIALPILRHIPKDVRLIISTSLIWMFIVGAWGYIWQWDDELSLERYLALFALPPIGGWLAFLLWKWSRAG
ncbi:MAG TPA: hypothetical protein DIW27_05505 [Cytophagales bacterium]|nr:hypothetical protein [Cytophagales bacterium]